MDRFTIFVVEDDQFYGQLLSFHLTLNPDYHVEHFTNGTDVLKSLYKNPAVITIDYSLPDMKGDFLMKKIHETNPEITIIIISGQEDISTAVKLLKEGAWDYITKDDETKDRLWNAIKNIRQNHSLRKELQELRTEVSQKYSFSNAIKGRSPEIKKVFALMEKAANSKITVTITGETGTGKELAAKAIHYSSDRKKKPFIAINVSAIPRELIESEFFGYEKGAFTGADSRKTGKFEEANGGTLFLDEIGEMELNMQAKLLRVLQEKEFTRIGGNQVNKTDFRLIVATNRNLAEMVKIKKFREDLYYRLLGLPIHLPPLRERNNDIILLANFFIGEYCKENGLELKSLDLSAQKKLMQYSFPGNIRELKAIVDLACVMCKSEIIKAEDLNFNEHYSVDSLVMEELKLHEYERKIIGHFLSKYNNNVVLVAQKLGVGKSTIYRMLKNREL